MPHPLREGRETLDLIKKVLDLLGKTNDRGNLAKERKLFKRFHLNGAIMLFWQDWRHAEPCLFFAPDALHQWHKFYETHILQWAKRWATPEELDRRIARLQHWVGRRHFPNGFTRYRQHTGKETKALERILLGVLTGLVDGRVLRAVRALQDFITVAQYRSQSTITIGYLKDYLREFHRYKQAIADSGVRDGPRQDGKFNIPKIELMQHVPRMVEQLGSLRQYTTELPESLHSIKAKRPYQRTNKKDGYGGQICRIQDREEKILFMTLLLALCHTLCSISLTALTSAQQEKVVQQMTGLYLISDQNIFERKTALCSNMTAFQLRKIPHFEDISIDDAEPLYYTLTHFREDLRSYFLGPRVRQDATLPFSSISIWDRVRVQLRNPQDEELVIEPCTVLATPRINHGKGKQVATGRFNFILLHRDDNSGNSNDFGVRGAFCLKSNRDSILKSICSQAALLRSCE